MRREGRWISSKCDYFLGRETDRRRFRRVSVRMPRYHSDHRVLVAVIYAERGGELKRYRRRTQRFPRCHRTATVALCAAAAPPQRRRQHRAVALPPPPRPSLVDCFFFTFIVSWAVSQQVSQHAMICW